jgi:hypothetical protein
LGTNEISAFCQRPCLVTSRLVKQTLWENFTFQRVSKTSIP